jgi:hypothetical protein
LNDAISASSSLFQQFYIYNILPDLAEEEQYIGRGSAKSMGLVGMQRNNLYKLVSIIGPDFKIALYTQAFTLECGHAFPFMFIRPL